MDGEAALLIDHRVARIRAAVAADNQVRVTGEQVDDFALALVAPMPADDRSYRHRPTLPSRRLLIRVMGACGPPGASRCSARASLRTPSRPLPPRDGASPAVNLADSETIGVNSCPSADSTSRGVAAGRIAVYPEARLAARSGQRGTS